MALLGLHEYLCKEISCTPRLTLVKGISIRKGSRKIYTLMRIFLTRKKPSSPRNKCQLYAITKTPKSSQTKVRIIYPSSGTLELWKFSNLNFKEYLAGTTPVLSTRSFLFLFHRFYLEYMRTMSLTEDFWYHQLVLFVGKKTVTTILPLPRQRVVRYSLARWQPITIP